MVTLVGALVLRILGQLKQWADRMSGYGEKRTSQPRGSDVRFRAHSCRSRRVGGTADSDPGCVKTFFAWPSTQV